MAGRTRRSVRLNSVGKNTSGFISTTSNQFSSIYNRTVDKIKNWRLKDRTKKVTKRTFVFVDKRPIASFLTVLGILLVLIVLGNFLGRPKEAQKPQTPARVVQIYSIGEAPLTSFQGSVEKTGVIKIIAQTSGIVESVNVYEGQNVDSGTVLLSLANNYQGGNAASLQRQMAQAQYETAKSIYDAQKDAINNERQIAEKNDNNQDELRQITSNSIDATQSLLNLNEQILTTLNDQRKQLENTNTNGGNDTQLLQIRQLIAQLQAGTNQLRTGLQTAKYSVPSDNPQAQISDLQKQAALKQLDVQQNSLALALETSRIQYQLALVNEATFFPSYPYSGTVEAVFVVPGQSVTPGMELATLRTKGISKIVVKVPQQIAYNISPVETAKLHIGNKIIEKKPFYISKEATDGDLYSILFILKEDLDNKLTNKGFITIDLPIGLPSTTETIPFIPIDAVYQSQNESYVYINNNGTATSKKVELGDVFGKFVQVKTGLSKKDQVILNRTVVAGDKVKRET